MSDKPLESWQTEDAARLKMLFQNHKPPITQASFGAQFEIGVQGMVWQYLNGKRPLSIDSATKFARGLGVVIDDFSPTIAAQIRDAFTLIRSTKDWPFEDVERSQYFALSERDRAKVEGYVERVISERMADGRKMADGKPAA